MIESTNTMDLGLIRDDANPLDKQVRYGDEMISEMFRKNRQYDNTDTIEVTEIEGHTETTRTPDTRGTSSFPSPIQFLPPRMRSVLAGLIMISQSMWDEAM